MLSIRMTRMGSKKKPYFRLVVSEGRSALQSRFVESLGTYNPRTKPAKVEINRERVQYWLTKGAKPSDSVRTLLARHLTRDLSAAVEPASAEASAFATAPADKSAGGATA
jgi:small subunit ribosomal protein S16